MITLKAIGYWQERVYAPAETAPLKQSGWLDSEWSPYPQGIISALGTPKSSTTGRFGIAGSRHLPSNISFLRIRLSGARRWLRNWLRASVLGGGVLPLCRSIRFAVIALVVVSHNTEAYANFGKARSASWAYFFGNRTAK